MIKYFIYIVLLIFSTLEINAAITEPVQLTCTKVLDDGSVEIYWNNPDVMTGFQEFKIYRVGNPNPIASSDIENLTYYHDDMVDAQLSRQYYFVDIVYQSSDIIRSLTISTIFLQLDNSILGNSTLLWNTVQDPLPEGSLNYYTVSKSINEEGTPYDWEIIGDNVQNQLFNYTIEDGVCNKFINFKVEIESTNGCSSVSNISGDLFTETNLPETPVFDSVSIQNNTNAIIGWQASSSSDVAEYILYEIQENGVALEFTRVTDLFYVDLRYNACNENRRYDIAAIDNCGNIGLRVQNPQRPILMYDIGFNVCANQDTLRWEQYINAEVENYLIWRKDNNADYELIGSLPMPESDTIILIYIDDDIIPGTTYEYFIQAVLENGTSSSCKKTITNYTYKIPQDIYFVNADVTPENVINLALEVDTAVYSCLWEIHRINSLTNNVDNFKSFRRSEIDDPYLEFIDTDIDPQTTSYEYYAKVFDSCSILRLESNHLKTIFLEGSKPDEQTNHLSWNAFEGWETDVEKYYIYRSSRTASNFILIDSIDYQTFEYDDIISTEEANEGVFYYWVEAKQIVGIEYDYEAYSASNIVSLFFENSVYFPNAFRPDGITNEFKPIFNYFGGSDYVFQIYNRWGQLIFETSDPEEGWDGKTNGESTSSASFVYYLNYKNVHGLGIEKKGSVILLK